MLAETCCAGAGLGSKNALTTENDGPSGGNSGGGRNGKPVLLPGKSATGDRSDSARTPSNRRLVLRDRVRPLHLIHEGALRLFCPSLDGLQRVRAGKPPRPVGQPPLATLQALHLARQAVSESTPRSPSSAGDSAGVEAVSSPS